MLCCHWVTSVSYGVILLIFLSAVAVPQIFIDKTWIRGVICAAVTVLATALSHAWHTYVFSRPLNQLSVSLAKARRYDVRQFTVNGAASRQKPLTGEDARILRDIKGDSRKHIPSVDGLHLKLHDVLEQLLLHSGDTERDVVFREQDMMQRHQQFIQDRYQNYHSPEIGSPSYPPVELQEMHTHVVNDTPVSVNIRDHENSNAALFSSSGKPAQSHSMVMATPVLSTAAGDFQKQIAEYDNIGQQKGDIKRQPLPFGSGETPEQNNSLARQGDDVGGQSQNQTNVKSEEISQESRVNDRLQTLKRLKAIQLTRGSRFIDDNKNIAIYIGRSKNGNLVVYEGQCGSDNELKASSTMDAYWLKIDVDNMARRRARGDMENRVDLSWLEKKAAYGVSTSAIKKEKDIPSYPDDLCNGNISSSSINNKNFILYMTAFKSKPLYLRMNNVLLESAEVGDIRNDWDKMKSIPSDADAAAAGIEVLPVVYTVLAEKASAVEKIWVQLVEGTQDRTIPTVEYVELTGVWLGDGLTRVRERLDTSGKTLETEVIAPLP